MENTMGENKKHHRGREANKPPFPANNRLQAWFRPLKFSPEKTRCIKRLRWKQMVGIYLWLFTYNRGEWVVHLFILKLPRVLPRATPPLSSFDFKNSSLHSARNHSSHSFFFGWIFFLSSFIFKLLTLQKLPWHTTSSTLLSLLPPLALSLPVPLISHFNRL